MPQPISRRRVVVSTAFSALLGIAGCVGSSPTPAPLAESLPECPVQGSTSPFPPEMMDRRSPFHTLMVRFSGLIQGGALEPLWCGGLPSSEVYRLLWMPSFEPAAIVEVVPGTDRWSVAVVEFADPLQQRLSQVVRRRTESAPKELGDRLLEGLRTADFWNAKPWDTELSHDGTMIVLEGRRNGKYGFVLRHNPGADPLSPAARTIAQMGSLPM
jgi:hypothetical protein